MHNVILVGKSYNLLFPFGDNDLNGNVKGLLSLLTMMDFMKGLIGENEFLCDLKEEEFPTRMCL